MRQLSFKTEGRLEDKPAIFDRNMSSNNRRGNDGVTGSPQVPRPHNAGDSHHMLSNGLRSGVHRTFAEEDTLRRVEGLAKEPPVAGPTLDRGSIPKSRKAVSEFAFNILATSSDRAGGFHKRAVAPGPRRFMWRCR